MISSLFKCFVFWSSLFFFPCFLFLNGLAVCGSMSPILNSLFFNKILITIQKINIKKKSKLTITNIQFLITVKSVLDVNKIKRTGNKGGENRFLIHFILQTKYMY